MMMKPFVVLTTLITMSCFSIVVPVRCATTTAMAVEAAGKDGEQQQQAENEKNDGDRKLTFKDILVAGYAVQGDEEQLRESEGPPHSLPEAETGTVSTTASTTTTAVCENVYFEYMTHVSEPNMAIKFVKWNKGSVSSTEVKIFGTEINAVSDTTSTTTDVSTVETIFETNAPEEGKEYKETKCLDLQNTCYVFYVRNSIDNRMKGFVNGYVEIRKDNRNVFQVVDSTVGCYVGVKCGDTGNDIVEANVKQMGIFDTEMIYVALGAQCQN